MKRCLTEDVIKDLMGNTHALDELENEWKALQEDRQRVRNTFPKGDSKIVLPCNIMRLIWNAQKIFKLDLRKPTDLHPLKVVEGTRELSKKFVIVKVGACSCWSKGVFAMYSAYRVL